MKETFKRRSKARNKASRCAAERTTPVASPPGEPVAEGEAVETPLLKPPSFGSLKSDVHKPP